MGYLRRDIPNPKSTRRSELAREPPLIREQARSYKVKNPGHYLTLTFSKSTSKKLVRLQNNAVT